MDEDLERLKQDLPLLEYLQRHNWSGRRAGTRMRARWRPDPFCGVPSTICPFIRVLLISNRELASVAHSASDSELLAQVAAFYQLELHRHPEAVHYLECRGLSDSVLIEGLGIGYARGGNLRRHLAALGYSLDELLDTA